MGYREPKKKRASRTAKPSSTSRRFGVLYGLGTVLVWIGWLVAASGVIIGLNGFEKLGGYDEAEAYGWLLVGLGMGLSGLLTVAAGQISQCFVSIEENTRRPAEGRATPAAGSPEVIEAERSDGRHGEALRDGMWRCRCGAVNPDRKEQCGKCGRVPEAVI